MKYQLAAISMACATMSASAFVAPASNAFGVTSMTSKSSLNMVLESPKKEKKLSKIEILKSNSEHLIHPLKEVSCSWNSFVLLASMKFK
jgi:hypothetical protein